MSILVMMDWLFSKYHRRLKIYPKEISQDGQKESGRRAISPILAVVAACYGLALGAAVANDGLSAGGLSFRDFATADNGASFSQGDPISGGGPNQVSSRVLVVDSANGSARIRFDSIRVELALPLGWQATEDWERGVGYSADKRYRVIVWRVDFAFEGVKDAEHYAGTKAGAIRARRPSIQTQARKLADGSYLIAYENVPARQGDGGEPRVVVDLVVPNPGNAKEGVLLTLGVPASDGERALKFLALLKLSMRIDW